MANSVEFPKALDCDFATRVRDSFSRQNAMGFIGAHLIRVDPGLVEIELPYRDELTQQHKFFHGGITTMIADSAGGYAGYSLFPAASSVLTVEFKISLLAPAAGDRLVATGRVIRPGRTLTICDLEVNAWQGSKATAVLKGLQTLICLHDRSDRAA